MPKRRTSDVPHAIMTDHLIQRRPSNGATATATTYQGEVVPYYPSDAARADPLTVAAAQVVNNSNLTAGIPRLSGQLAKGAQSAEAYVILGDAWRHSKRPDQAAPAYEQAAKLNPASTRAQRSWGVALKESGQFTQAAETLKRAVQQMPEDPENWYELGLLDSEQGRPADAIAELQKAVALDPDLAAGYNNLGGNLAALGRMDEAQTAFREALRIDPYDASAHANLGQFLASTPAPRGSAAQAAEEFAKAVKLQPENARNRYLYGIVLAQLGHLDEARKQLEAALQADPKLAPAHELLGRFLEQSRNLDAALREYGEAVEIQPDFGRAHLDIAAVLAARGDLSGAASQLKMAAAGKDPAAAQEAVAGLRQLEEKRVR
jgi:tetratricopeptide (TPR) repeat protein